MDIGHIGLPFISLGGVVDKMIMHYLRDWIKLLKHVLQFFGDKVMKNSSMQDHMKEA